MKSMIVTLSYFFKHYEIIKYPHNEVLLFEVQLVIFGVRFHMRYDYKNRILFTAKELLLYLPMVGAFTVDDIEPIRNQKALYEFKNYEDFKDKYPEYLI